MESNHSSAVLSVMKGLLVHYQTLYSLLTYIDRDKAATDLKITFLQVNNQSQIVELELVKDNEVGSNSNETISGNGNSVVEIQPPSEGSGVSSKTEIERFEDFEMFQESLMKYTGDEKLYDEEQVITEEKELNETLLQKLIDNNIFEFSNIVVDDKIIVDEEKILNVSVGDEYREHSVQNDRKEITVDNEYKAYEYNKSSDEYKYKLIDNKMFELTDIVVDDKIIVEEEQIENVFVGDEYREHYVQNDRKKITVDNEYKAYEYNKFSDEYEHKDYYDDKKYKEYSDVNESMEYSVENTKEEQIEEKFIKSDREYETPLHNKIDKNTKRRRFLPEKEAPFSYDCHECGSNMKSYDDNRLHNFMEHGVRLTFRCNLCDFSALKNDNLRKHKLEDHGVEVKNTNCPECDFTNVANLRNHIDHKHGGVIYKCNLCPFVNVRYNRFAAHRESEHEGLRYCCEMCELIFSTKLRLLNHIQHEHNCKRNYGRYKKTVIKTLNEIKSIIEPMSYVEAKRFVSRLAPTWRKNSKVILEELKRALLEFGWELGGPSTVPVCNEMGRERLRKLYS